MRVIEGGSTVPEEGDQLTLISGDHNEHVNTVTITRVFAGGTHVSVRFLSGSELVKVPITMLGLGARAHHGHRNNDPDTSVEAAVAASTDMTHNQIIVLRALAAAGTHGLIDHEHHPVNGLDQDTAGKRRGELRALGLVVDSGHRRKTPRGRNAIVWCITVAGTGVLNRLNRQGAA